MRPQASRSSGIRFFGTHRNYTLQCTSPCAPENNPDCGLIGALQVGCDPQGFSDFDPARDSRLQLRIEPIGIGLGSVSIRYYIPETLRPDHVRLDVFDVGGCLVKTVLDEPARPGHAWVRWDETDETNRPVACGCTIVA